MAPNFAMDTRGQADAIVTATPELWLPAVVAVLFAVSVAVSLALVVLICCCCDSDKEKRTMQEKMDAAIAPPPTPAASTMTTGMQPPSSKPSPSPSPKRGGKFQSPPAFESSKQPDGTLQSAPRGGARPPPNTLQSAPRGRPWQAPPNQSMPRGGVTQLPPDTLALAKSDIFEKPGGARPPPASDAAPLATMTLADSKVFDK